MAFLHPSTRSSSGNLNSPSPTMMKTASLSAWINALRHIAAVLLLGLAPLAHAQVSLPNGTPDVPVVDLRVKVLGGWVTIDRQWWEGSWRLNQRWDPIQLGGSASGEGGCQAYPTLTVQGRSYVGDGLNWLLENRYSARATDYFTGSDCQANRIRLVRWQDRISGSWMEYERTDASQLQFRLARYGDRNNVTVNLVYNAAGQLSEIRDHFNTPVIRYTYTGGQLTDIRDLPTAADPSPSRIVQYTWGSTTWSGQTIPTITKVTDVLGHATNYGINSGRLETITDPEGRIRRFAYTADRITQYTDGMGYITKYVYDYDKLKKEFSVRVTGPGTVAEPGTVTELFYAADGKLNRRDIAGVTTYKRSQVDSRTEAREDSAGRKTTVVKDEYDNIVGITYPDGAQKTSKYSPVHGQMTEEVDEIGVKTTYDYDSAGNLIKKTEALGLPEQRVTEYARNSFGQVTRITRKGRTESNGSVTPDVSIQGLPDAYGNYQTITDPENNAEHYTYTRRGNTRSITDALGKVWQATYDAAGNIKTISDPLNHQSNYTYDKTSNLVSETDARGKTYQYQYDANDREIKQIDPYSNVYETKHSPGGQLSKVTDASGKLLQLEYDAMRRLKKATDGKGQNYLFDYSAEDGSERGLRKARKVTYPTFERQDKFDNRDRRTQSTLLDGAEGRVHGFSYDGRGSTKTVTDANGKTRYLDYDAFGYVIQAKNPAGNTVRFLRDTRGNVIAITDPLGKVTRMAYDKRGLLVSSTDPLSKTTGYVYDAGGRLTEIQQANGKRIVYSYDDAGRVNQHREYAAGGNLQKTTAYSYDNADNLTGWSDGAVSSASVYDDADRLTSETLNYGSFSLTHSYTYYPNNQVASYTGPDGVTVSYTYDEQGQMQSLTIPGEGSLTVTDWKWTEPTKVLLPGGTQQQMSYDGYLAMTSLKVVNPAQAVLFELQNQYGKLSELKQGSQDGTSVSYTHDEATRLTKVDGGIFSGKNETFEVDAIGNRTKHDRAGSDAWQYDDANQLKVRGPISYDYDDAGNQVRKTDSRLVEPARTTNYAYDAFNRLSEITDGAGNLVARYNYDPFDRRISKTIGAGATGVPTGTTWYLHSEWGLLGEADNSGSVRAIYGWHPNRENGTGPLYTRVPANGGGMRYAYYHNDHLGTPIRATDTAGSLVWAADYDAFGRASVRDAGAEGITSNLRYPGQYFDVETGLHYNDRRYYDADTGRYTTRDPLGFEGGINLYAYARHSPNNFIDPTGEFLPLLGCLAANYARCVAACMLIDTALDALSGCEIDWAGNLKDCLVDCVLGMLPIPNPCGKFGKAFGVGVGVGAGMAEGLMDSFPGETLVHVRPKGASAGDAKRGLTTLKPISQLKETDEVLALAEWKDAGKEKGVDQRLSYEKVQEVKITSQRQRTLVDLKLEDGKTLTATDGHPFNTPEGWRDATMLKKGGKLLLKDEREGTLREAEILETVQRSELVTTYNLEVANAHTFFVGEDGVLVHNGFGSYTCHYRNKKTGKKMRYHGKGDENRARASQKDRLNELNREHGDGWEPDTSNHEKGYDFKPSSSDRDSFVDEANRIRGDGGIGTQNGNLNRINSPGERILGRSK